MVSFGLVVEMSLLTILRGLSGLVGRGLLKVRLSLLAARVVGTGCLGTLLRQLRVRRRACLRRCWARLLLGTR